MFNWVLGPPGNGKSLFLMKQMEWELAHSKRNIATNLSVKMAELQAYMNRTYPEALVDVWQRVRLLDQNEAYFFWRYRGYNKEGADIVWQPETFSEVVNGMSVTKIKWPEALADDPGVVALIDEMQEIYDQTTWASIAKEGRSALSQHRKFRMDAWLASPYLDQVAKPFREIAQAYYYTRNSGYERVGYGKLTFKYATRFFYNVFRHPMRSDNDKPYCGGQYSLDVEGIAKCYNTAAGVGVENRIADQGLERKGLAAWLKWPALAAGALLLMVAIRVGVWGIPKGLRSMASFGTRNIVGTSQQKKPSPAPPVAVATPPPFLRRPQLPAISSATRQPERVAVFVRWVSQIGGNIRFGLSDGRTLINPAAVWDGNNLQLPTGERFAYQPVIQPSQPSELSRPFRPLGVIQ